MKKILLTALLLLACVPLAHAEYLVTDPYIPGGGICGDPTQFAIRYNVTGLPITVTNPIAAQSDTSLLLDVSSTPVGGPYIIQYWAEVTCNNGYVGQTTGKGTFTYWRKSDGSWPYIDASNQGMFFVSSGGTGNIAPASGHTGKAVLYTPTPSISPSFRNVYTAWGTVPASVEAQLRYVFLGTAGWSLSSDQSWLTVTPSSGTSSATLTCVFNSSVAQMHGGSYTANVTVTSPGASNSGMTFQICLSVDKGILIGGKRPVINVGGLLYFGTQEVLLGASTVGISGWPYIYK